MPAHIEREVKGEPASDFTRYGVLLTKFGIDASHFNSRSEDEKRNIEKVLEDLQFLFELIPDASSYTLINLAEVLFDEQEIELSHAVSSTNISLNHGSEETEKALAKIYLGLSFAGVIFSIAALFNYSQDKIVSTIFGSFWNYADSAGVIGAARQLHQEELALGVGNIAGNVQSLSCTIIANVLQYSYHASAATVTGLLGFSAAAGMWISFGLELYEVHKCNNKIKSLEKKLERIDEESSAHQLIQKAILIEKAQRENHIRNAKSWAGCAIALTVVAVVSMVAVSGLTFGALPAMMVLLSAVVFATAFIRQWWVGKKNHVENIKESLKKKDRNSLLDRLNREMIENKLSLDFTEVITVRKSTFFGDTKIPLKEYLRNLLVHNPRKLESIVAALEAADPDRLNLALNPALHSSVIGKVGERTRGIITIKSLNLRSMQALVNFGFS